MGNREKDIFVKGLSRKESELLWLLSQGWSVPEIASMTHRSVNTIEVQLYGLRKKAGARSAAHLVWIGMTEGWVKEHH